MDFWNCTGESDAEVDAETVGSGAAIGLYPKFELEIGMVGVRIQPYLLSRIDPWRRNHPLLATRATAVKMLVFLIRTNGTMARFAASLLAASLAVSIFPDAAFTQAVQRPPLPLLTPHGRPAAKMEHRGSAVRQKQPRKSAMTRKKEHRQKVGESHQESAEKKQKRAECKEQAQKLLDDAGRRAYMKECISNP